MDTIEELLTRGVANIIPDKKQLETLLRSGKKLNIYLGIDPTAPHIHLGHAVPLRKLQIFAELGHHVSLLIGDFTTLVGDTSDKESERPILTQEEIEKTFQTYKRQAEKVLDFSRITIVHNRDWLEKLTYKDIIKLQQQFSLNDFISRELIRKRLDEGKRVRLDETSYPLMQGYDSYFLDTDIQLGGTDQTFNMQAGRTLQKVFRQKESFVMTNIFLDGTDGRKMSKSWGNAIWLDDSAEDMYAKVMAIKDEVIIQYFTLATHLPLAEIAEIEQSLRNGAHPMQIKKRLADEIVADLYSKDVAQKAAAYFEKTVQEKEKPQDLPAVKIDIQNKTLADILVETKLAQSKSDAKRLIEQGGVKIDENVINTPLQPFQDIIKHKEAIIQVGKRKFVKIHTQS